MTPRNLPAVFFHDDTLIQSHDGVNILEGDPCLDHFVGGEFP